MKHVLEMTDDERERAEWRGVAHTLREAKRRLEADGTRHTWIDPDIAIADERGREPSVS